MGKAVLISIKPKWCELIANGKKTIEVRKTRPKLETPFKCYIYCTKEGRPLVYGDTPAPWGREEKYTQTYGYSKEEANRIWDVMNGKVIGEFVCDEIVSMCDNILSGRGNEDIKFLSCLSGKELNDYANGKELFAWHISDLKIYDEPKELREITKCRYEYCKGWCGSALGVLCSCQMALFPEEEPPKVDLNIVKCTRADKRPPRSWCYVEELT